MDKQIRMSASEEAYIDFPEEEIPDDVSESIRKKIVNIENEINQCLLYSFNRSFCGTAVHKIYNPHCRDQTM